MSIEQYLERIATALEALVKLKDNTEQPGVDVIAPVTIKPAESVTPVVGAGAAASGSPIVLTAPFRDVAGLIDYAMKAYQALGAENGAKIQGILTDLGYADIKSVQPMHFGPFYTAVETLKGA